MRKWHLILYPLFIFSLIACSARSVSEVSPAYQSNGFGGGLDGEFAAEDEAASFVAKTSADIDATYDQNELNGDRLVIKNADISIVVEDPLNSLDEIISMTDDMDGFVVSSNIYQTTMNNGAKVPHASITIRIPSGKLDEALTIIKSGAGDILYENISGDDVTREYIDMNSRLGNLEAAESQLIEIMEEASETEDVLEVFNQLTNIRSQIEVIKGQITYFQQAAALSAISVELTADAAIQPLQIGNWQPAGVAKEAIQTLINTLQWLANGAIWFALCVLPVGIVIGIPLFFFRRLAKKRGFRLKKSTKKTENAPKEGI